MTEITEITEMKGGMTGGRMDKRTDESKEGTKKRSVDESKEAWKDLKEEEIGRKEGTKEPSNKGRKR